MISASHNPYHDNGIKLFGPDGYKLSDGIEVEIEALWRRPADGWPRRPSSAARSGIDDAHGRYIETSRAASPRGYLDGLKIVVDSAHGAAYNLAADLFLRAGGRGGPDRRRAQRPQHQPGCGSNEPAMLRETVLARGRRSRRGARRRRRPAGAGRRAGAVIDGDQVLALIARSWRRRPPARRRVVATVMSNLGLESYLAGLGLALHRTKVGDRYVVERMRADGYNVGGEQSGHIILSDFATTGDGLLAALQVLAVILRRGPPGLRGRPACSQPVPQRLRNVRHSAPPRPGGTRDRGAARAPAGAARRHRPAAGARIGHRASDPRHGRGRGRGPAGRRSGDRQPADHRSGAARRLTSGDRHRGRRQRFLTRPAVAAACSGSYMRATRGAPLPATGPSSPSPAAPSPGRGFSRLTREVGMSKIIGIDLGTTNSCVAIMEGKNVRGDRERGGHAHDALDGGLHRGRRGAGRHAGQAPGGDQSREHRCSRSSA